jgi:hypothetical protein
MAITGGIKIDLSGFDSILRKFETLPIELQEEIDGELETAAKDFAAGAKRTLADKLSLNNNRKTGRLMGSINFAPFPNIPHSWEAFAQTTYAAYNEWGTINYVSVPPDLAEIAIRYKGHGIRKTGGMKAKHYFYSQRALVVPKLMENLNRAIESTLNK